METILGEGNQSNITVICFVLSSGANVITECEYLEGEDGELELYWMQPMICQRVKLPDGRDNINMMSFSQFSKESKVGPINDLSIVTTYIPDETIIQVYKEAMLQLNAKKAGLVTASSLPKNMVGNGMKIGGGR